MKPSRERASEAHSSSWGDFIIGNVSMAYSRPTKVTAQSVERNIQARRNIEVQKREYMAFSDENSKLLYTANAQEKIEARRRMTHQQQCAAQCSGSKCQAQRASARGRIPPRPAPTAILIWRNRDYRFAP